jgi:fatty-acyl-CoA synthase
VDHYRARRDACLPASGEAGAIYEAIAREGVTHLCGAPVVMNMLLNAGPGLRRSLDRRIEMMTAVRHPPPQ